MVKVGTLCCAATDTMQELSGTAGAKPMYFCFTGTGERLSHCPPQLA